MNYEANGLELLRDDFEKLEEEDMPTDEEVERMRLEKIRKESIHAKYAKKKQDIREHTARLRKQIEVLEDNIQRNNALMDDITNMEWKEIYN